jgi:hypothetical protein
MRPFTDEHGRAWVAGATEEDTPRHHGRWYLVLHPADAEAPRLDLPEVRWQSLGEAERTLATMSLFDIRRRLAGAQRRAGAPAPGGEGVPWIGHKIKAS